MTELANGGGFVASRAANDANDVDDDDDLERSLDFEYEVHSSVFLLGTQTFGEFAYCTFVASELSKRLRSVAVIGT